VADPSADRATDPSDDPDAAEAVVDRAAPVSPRAPGNLGLEVSSGRASPPSGMVWPLAQACSAPACLPEAALRRASRYGFEDARGAACGGGAAAAALEADASVSAKSRAPVDGDAPCVGPAAWRGGLL
jgi:hypothetical protein